MNNNKKWYSAEVPCDTETDLARAEKFREWLINSSFRFEISGSFNMIHFEIEANPDFLSVIDSALIEIVYPDSITEVN